MSRPGTLAMIAAALLAACAGEPVSRESILEVLASESPQPELGELFWDAQRRQATELWAYGADYCSSNPGRPNCAPVANLLRIEQLTQAPQEDPP